MLTPEARGYLAGIIDGEGYIGGCRAPGGRHHLRLVVTSTDPALPEHLRAMAGCGTVRTHVKHDGVRKPATYWRCFGASAAALLEQVLPLLVVKRTQAEKALALHGTVAMEDRAQLAAEIRSLNSRRRAS